MKGELITLREAASQLGVPPHVVVYALVSGKASEPVRISGRRMFSEDDIDQLRQVLNVTSEDGTEVKWAKPILIPHL
jgi:DNA-binding transcriptional MerR regulator